MVNPALTMMRENVACAVDSLCRAVRDLNMTSGASMSAGKEAPVMREKKLVSSYIVKSGMLRFNFMLDCCNPGTLPDAHLIAALLDLVSTNLYEINDSFFGWWRSFFN